MTPRGKRHVLIIGGGASGVLLACHLLRDPDSGVSVTLIEKRADIGRGIAYGTANPDHVLNVRAAFMSAFPERAPANAHGPGRMRFHYRSAIRCIRDVSGRLTAFG